MNFVSYWFSDRIALAMHGARELPRSELPWLHALLDEVARRAYLPRPRLHVMDTDTPKAFATGRSPEHSAVAITTGLLQLLDRRELAGVLAHEVAHVKNRDTLIMTVAATLAGVITHLAQMAFVWAGACWAATTTRTRARRSSAPSACSSSRPSRRRCSSSPSAVRRVVTMREFDADATAAELTGGARSARQRAVPPRAGSRLLPMDRSPASAHLFVVNPPSSGSVMGLFATHPPIGARIEKLLAMRG
jgi:heat shock protein HtpX